MSDLASTSILELEAWADGDSVIFDGKASNSVSEDTVNEDSLTTSNNTTNNSLDTTKNDNNNNHTSTNDTITTTTSTTTTTTSTTNNNLSDIEKQELQRQKQKQLQLHYLQQQYNNHNLNRPSSASDSKATDDLYHEFIKTASSTDNENTPKVIADWISRLRQLDGAKERITSIFLLSIPTKASDTALIALYNSGYVNLQALDEINNQSVLHKACIAGRTLIVDLALKQNVKPTLQDTYGRTALHYACLYNHANLIKRLVDRGANIDALDKDNFTPLLYSIIKKHSNCVRLLIDLGAKTDGDSEKYYIPLNFACQYGVYDAAKLLLQRSPSVIKPDAEGLYPIHIVARAGHWRIIPLLTQYNNINVNEVDKLNKWTALFYAASEGHVQAVKELLKANAHVDILDEEGHTPLYYATWEGHVECMEELSLSLAQSGVSSSQLDQSRPVPITATASGQSSSFLPIDGFSKHHHHNHNHDALSSSSSSFSPNDMDIEGTDIDGIPDLSLPPPILPLRRYGHNFLDKKIFVQLIFDLSSTAHSKPIEFDKGDNSLPAGRLTIASRNNHDIIPQSIILPFSDSDRIVSFQVDSLRNFAIDFEIYPTYGTRVVAKTAALSYIFNKSPSENPEYHILGTRHFCTLPLFDMRLQTVGKINFAFQIVLPFSGEPLEITKFDTYWKSTSQVEQQQQQQLQQLSSSLSSSLQQSSSQLSSHMQQFPHLSSISSHNNNNNNNNSNSSSHHHHQQDSSQSQVQLLLQSQRSGSPIISNTLNSIVSGTTNINPSIPIPSAPSFLSSSNSLMGTGPASSAGFGPSSVHHHHGANSSLSGSLGGLPGSSSGFGGFSQTLSFVTASSLSGEFARISVCLTRDLVPVVATFWDISVNGISIPIGHLNLDQVLTIAAASSKPKPTTAKPYAQESKQLVAAASTAEAIHDASNGRIIPLKDFLESAPVEAKLDISVLYPTRAEAVYMNLGVSTFPDLNVYVDKILTILFDHVRAVRSLRHQDNAPFGASPLQTRSVIFSSAHPDVCTVLNWKQPNYPVFFHVNAISIDSRALAEVSGSGNSHSQGEIKSNNNVTSSIPTKIPNEASNVNSDIDIDLDLDDDNDDSINQVQQQQQSKNTNTNYHHGFSIVSAHGLPVKETDRRCTSLKDATAFAANNNLLGVVCSSSLLSLVPSLVGTIRVFGLVLVSETISSLPKQYQQSQSPTLGITMSPNMNQSSSITAAVAAVAGTSLPGNDSFSLNSNNDINSSSSITNSEQQQQQQQLQQSSTSGFSQTSSLSSIFSTNNAPPIISSLSPSLPTTTNNNNNNNNIPNTIPHMPAGVDGYRTHRVLKFKGAIDM